MTCIQGDKTRKKQKQDESHWHLGNQRGIWSCPLLFWGRSSDLQNDPNLQANLNFQAGPTNKSSIFEDGWGTFASATHNISWGHPFLRMGGDALSCLRVKAEG